jgi:hypothetical protein
MCSILYLFYYKEASLDDDDLVVESEDDDGEPLTVRLTICRVNLYY